MKENYIKPELKIHKVIIQNPDVLTSSDVEWYKEYIDPNPGDWDDPIIDPDDEIEW